MHPAATPIFAFALTAGVLLATVALWLIHAALRRQAEAAEEANHLLDRGLWLLARRAAVDPHEAETKVLTRDERR